MHSDIGSDIMDIGSDIMDNVTPHLTESSSTESTEDQFPFGGELEVLIKENGKGKDQCKDKGKGKGNSNHWQEHRQGQEQSQAVDGSSSSKVLPITTLVVRGGVARQLKRKGIT